MSVADKASVLKLDFQTQLEKVVEVKNQLEEKIVLVEQMVLEHEEEVSAAHKAGYDEGKASVVLPGTGSGEKLFTQEDMDTLAKVAKEEKAKELQPVIDQAIADKEAVSAELEMVKLDLEASQANEAKAKADLEADQIKDAELAEQIKAAAEQIK